MSGEGVGEAYVPREVRPRWESGEVGQDRFTGAVTLIQYRHLAAAPETQLPQSRTLVEVTVLP